MHPELKSLIKNLPDMIVTEFNARAMPYAADFIFPVPVTALFNLLRADCLITAGIRLNMAAEMDQVRKHLGPTYKGYKRGDSEHEVTNKLVYAMRHVLTELSPQLYVSLSAFLMKVTSECDLLRMLGIHYADNMDQDLPPYVQYAMDWHRDWCVSPLPAEAQNNYPYPHTEVPVLVFMRHIVAAASGRSTNRAELPWTDEVEKVVYSKLEWLSPTETELLRIGTSRLDSRDVDNDFLKYFL